MSTTNRRMPKEGMKLNRVILSKSPALTTPAEFGVELQVWNATGSSIAADKFVYASAYNTTATVLEPQVTLASNAASTSLAMFITTEAIANGASGNVSKSSLITSANTNAGSVGDPVYLSTAGGWTLTQPSAGSVPQVIGRIITKSATAGVILVDLGGEQAVRDVIEANTSQEFIPIKLTDWREVSSNNIPIGLSAVVNSVITTVPAGLLSQDSTPILEFANGDTDSALRINWAASNADPIVMQTPLPPDLDTGSHVVLHLRAALTSAQDTTAINADCYFNEGDTKLSPATANITNSVGSYGEYTVTMSAADVPSGAQTLTVELTPGTHANDALVVSATWLEYTRKSLTS